ncbi:hypothetical protein [Aromatoleum petrolei]|uniref:Uncharacterized protein n=1 Tax=Aromatoleum petrolei TaxID=76116 RepID=A0ABX1MT41_9RHOO|nr:hypothetical protein [Aromatoleum petrolei]NMF91142.1 hypothetical protein [Aromatoleum petrolei]QTQ37624.1 Uncharacterized protein ToN1_35090 [Aromatoleum petrolei]
MTLSAATPSGLQERRSHPRVREIFIEACELIMPFFARENRWGNSTLDHLAYRVLRDHYPELSFEEVHVLVVAAHRVHATRGQQTRFNDA